MLLIIFFLLFSVSFCKDIYMILIYQIDFIYEYIDYFDVSKKKLSSKNQTVIRRENVLVRDLLYKFLVNRQLM